MSRYIELEGLDLISIPNFKHKSTSIFNFVPVNRYIICEHRFKTFSSIKLKALIFQKMNVNIHHFYLVMKISRI